MFSNINSITSAISGLSTIFNMKQEKNMILDPLTCIIRLAILAFKPPGTKISINNNKITYCEPSIFQGTLRLAFGDNREDLHNIYNPIKKATTWFSDKDEHINNLFVHAVSGLKVLKDSYSKNSTIYHTLKLYQDLIKLNLKKVKPNYNCVETDDERDEAEKTRARDLNKIYLKLKSLWSRRELSIINNLILELEHKKSTGCGKKNDINSNQEEIDAIFSALELILNVKEAMVMKMILEETTIL